MNINSFLIPLFALLFVGCISSSGEREEAKVPSVAVSVAPQAWFVDQIGGDLADVHIMVPKGTNPEEYDPAPRDIAALEKSDLFLYTGTLPYEEAWVKRLKDKAAKTVDVSGRLPRHLLYPGEGDDMEGNAHGHIHGDPHFWSSFEGGEALARITFEELLGLFPGDSVLLKKNYQSVAEKIEKLREEAAAAFGKENGKPAFLIYHPSLTAFAEENDLKQIAVEREGKDPSPKHLAEITAEALSLGAKVMLIQKEFNPAVALAIARQTNARTVEINPYEYDWEAQMKLLIDALSE